jgi:peptide/nickel transport system permease protein
MISFACRRFLQMALLLLAMSFTIFLLIGLMPGDPVDLMTAGNPHMTAADALRLRTLYGLDKPLTERYLHWLASATKGDLGYSRLYGLPVLQVIIPRLVNTLTLLGSALGLTVLAAVPLGVYAARHEGRMGDRVVSTLALAGMSAPPFWVALMFIYFFSVSLGWLPASADLNNFRSLILPVMALVISGLAVYVRHMRVAMAEALQAAYIRTARAKGCAESRVVWGHAFQGALIPVVTIFMLDLGTLCGGAVTIETVFAFPGMGKLMFDAVMGNDYNLALTGFLLLTAAVLVANFLADIVCSLLDPRVESGDGK